MAASLQAPTLFLIANDLSRMQVLADIDEADIGQLGPDSRVTFTVMPIRRTCSMDALLRFVLRRKRCRTWLRTPQ